MNPNRSFVALALLGALTPLGQDMFKAESPDLFKSKYPDRDRAEDFARMEAAQAKRRRKLERWTNTPEAKARQAETLAQLERSFVWSSRAKAYVPGVPQTVPPPYPDND